MRRLHIYHLRSLSPLRWLERFTALPYRDLFGVWTIMVLGCTLAYFILSSYLPGHGIRGIEELENMWMQLGDSLYFSLVTATTVGYGDLSPLGASRAVAAIEALMGFGLFAILVSKVVSQKQEIALFNMHTLAFQNAFSATSETLYILRHDCDRVMEMVRKEHRLGDDSRRNLRIVYQKSQTVLESILDFYPDYDWYALDTRREALLLESVHRTFERMGSVARLLTETQIDLRTDADVYIQRETLITLAVDIVARWKAHAASENVPWFGRIESAIVGI